MIISKNQRLDLEKVKRRLMIGTYVLSAGYYDAYYLKHLKLENLFRETLKTLLKM